MKFNRIEKENIIISVLFAILVAFAPVFFLKIVMAVFAISFFLFSLISFKKRKDIAKKRIQERLILLRACQIVILHKLEVDRIGRR